jgi:hypothetical protein
MSRASSVSGYRGALENDNNGRRPSAKALEPADGVWGHRKRTARGSAEREHCTGPQEI